MFTQYPALAAIDLHQLSGIAGFILYIYAFAAVQFSRLSGNSAAYSLINIAAATLVAISLISDFNLASALIQGSWIAIGFFGLALRFRRVTSFAQDDLEPVACAGVNA